jgi:hypothetical protein
MIININSVLSEGDWGVVLGYSEHPSKIKIYEETEAFDCWGFCDEQNFDVLLALLDEENIKGVPDFDAHNEPKSRLIIGDLYITDTATVGGIRVDEDGAYLYSNNEMGRY